MPRVAIYAFDEDGNDGEVGTISWDGTALKLDPEGSLRLTTIRDEIAVIDPDGGSVSAEEDPEKWLAGLYRTLTGAYLRAGKPVADDTPDLNRELVAAILELRSEGKDAAADALAELVDDPDAAANVAKPEPNG